MVSLVVPLRSRRLKRALAAQQLNHAVPTVGLIYSGLDALRHGVHGFELVLAIVEIVTSVFLIVTLARSIRAARAGTSATEHHARRVDWVDIWAAGVLFAEAGERWNTHHHIARPILLMAVFALTMGLCHRQVTAFRERRRGMRVSDEGLYVGGKPFTTLRAPWKDIKAVEVGDRFANVRTRAGRVRRIDLADLENAGDVRAALHEAARRAQIAARLEEPEPDRAPGVRVPEPEKE